MGVTTTTRTSTRTKVLTGVALGLGGAAVAAAIVSSGLKSPKVAATPLADISIVVEMASTDALDYRAADSKLVSVVLTNNGTKTAKNVSGTLEFDPALKYNYLSSAALETSAGVVAQGCTETYAKNTGEETNVITCTYDMPAGTKAEFLMNMEVDGVFAECGLEGLYTASMDATSTYANDPTALNNNADASIDIESFECPEVSINVTLEDESAMTYEDTDRNAIVSVTNSDETLDIYYTPISVFGYGGLRFNNIQTIEDIRGDDDDTDDSYAYDSYQFDSIDQTFVPVVIGAGVTENYEVPYSVGETVLGCGETTEAMILAGVASSTDSDMSNNTDKVTVNIAGVDCE